MTTPNSNHQRQHSNSTALGFSLSLTLSEKVILSLTSLVLSALSFGSGVFVGHTQMSKGQAEGTATAARNILVQQDVLNNLAK